MSLLIINELCVLKEDRRESQDTDRTVSFQPWDAIPASFALTCTLVRWLVGGGCSFFVDIQLCLLTYLS